MHHHIPLVKEDQSFDFQNLWVLILVSALDNSKAHVNNFSLLLEVALQCSQLEAIIIENSQTWIGLPQIVSLNTSIILQKKILNLCSTCASLKILDLVGLGFLQQLLHKFASAISYGD